jgi:multidrug efflux pump subunit AcrA (membrane-fusion protein)
MQSEAEAPITPLFRNEALRFQAARLQGEVFLKIRSPWLVLGMVCATLAFVMVASAALVTYDRKERAAGVLVSAGGIERLTSQRAARVGQVLARDGERVTAGQRLLTLVDAQGRQSAGNALLAPADLVVGVMHASPGQEVSAGQVLAELLPAAGHLEAQLSIAPAAIGFIKRGQLVRLRYDAFPARKFGQAQGKIASVSLMPAADGSYRARVALERNYVQAAGGRVALQPGMSFKSEIVIERRSLLEWLFEPLYALGARS